MTCVPEHHDRLMVIIIQSPIIRMFPEIIKVNRRVNTANQDLHFLLVEHPRRKFDTVSVAERNK